MSARSLRLLVAIAFVFTLFFYIASTQVNRMLPVKSTDEGLLGGPLPGLTRWQHEKFQEGRALFSKQFEIKDGLGPLFNERSCASCHGGAGTTGGAGTEPGYGSYTMFARRIPQGRFAAEPTSIAASKLEWQDMDFLLNKGGPFLIEKSISKMHPPVLAENCNLEANLNAPSDAEYQSKYFAPPLFGLGLVDGLSDFSINGQLMKEMDASNTAKARIAHVPALWQNVGRFGSKCRYATLYECTASELAHQIGISNPLHRHAITANGFDNLPDCIKAVCPADPNDDGKVLNKINFYLSLLAPPPRGPITPAVSRGEDAFQKTGCMVCHSKNLRTAEKVYVLNPDGPPLKSEELTPQAGGMPVVRLLEEPKFVEVRALEKKQFNPYSDFLIHDMGAKLADGIPAAGSKGGEWRTAPLWGLRNKKWYFHDGRAKTLTDAIKKHGGQAADSVKAFNLLTDAEKADLISFLSSL